MFRVKKSQQAVEFMLVVMFVLVIIAGVMYITGVLLGDLARQDQHDTAENFVKNIENEVDILSKVNGGYSRELEIYSQDYSVEILNDVIVVKDLYDDNLTYSYEIPLGLNVSMIYRIADNGQNISVINFEKENVVNREGLELLSVDEVVDWYSKDCDVLGCGVLADGASRLFFESATVPFGTSYISETRICDFGVLKPGSFVQLDCNENCDLGVDHGFNDVFYQFLTVPFGTSCISETRTCDDGTLDGIGYTNPSCSVDAPLNCIGPDSSLILHATSKTYYFSSSVPFGSSCVSQSRICTNGVLSGSYLFGSCSVDTPVCAAGNFETFTGTCNAFCAAKGL